MGSAVTLESVVALAGRFPVLAGVDLRVDTGELVVLRGANGAGKTSVLRVCAGLLPVASGRAVVLGADLAADRRAVRRRVGLLGHANLLYDDLSVADNVVFAVRAAGGQAAAAHSAMQRMGLSGRLLNARAAGLSAGQRRRAALSVLVARRPELWLLDEPYAGLDPDGRAAVDAVVADARAGGATVVVASHEAIGGGGRVLTVAGGRVEERALVA